MGKATDYYRANQGFATVYDGEPLWVAKGELVHKDHPLLKDRATLFERAVNFGRFDIERPAPAEKSHVLRKKQEPPKFGLTTTTTANVPEVEVDLDRAEPTGADQGPDRRDDE